jgi:hypothetical protein
MQQLVKGKSFYFYSDFGESRVAVPRGSGGQFSRGGVPRRTDAPVAASGAGSAADTERTVVRYVFVPARQRLERECVKRLFFFKPNLINMGAAT